MCWLKQTSTCIGLHNPGKFSNLCNWCGGQCFSWYFVNSMTTLSRYHLVVSLNDHCHNLYFALMCYSFFILYIQNDCDGYFEEWTVSAFHLQLNGIREDVEYYVEENQDDNFTENEYLYDDLDMDEEIGSQISATAPLATSPTEDNNFNLSGTSSTNNSNSPSPSPALTNHSKDESRSSKHVKNLDSDDSRVSSLNLVKLLKQNLWYWYLWQASFTIICAKIQMSNSRFYGTMLILY